MPYYKNYIYSPPYTSDSTQETRPIYTPTASEGSEEELRGFCSLTSGIYMNPPSESESSFLSAAGDHPPSILAIDREQEILEAATRRSTAMDSASDASSNGSNKRMHAMGRSSPSSAGGRPRKSSGIPRLAQATSVSPSPSPKKRTTSSTGRGDGRDGGGDYHLASLKEESKPQEPPTSEQQERLEESEPESLAESDKEYTEVQLAPPNDGLHRLLRVTLSAFQRLGRSPIVAVKNEAPEPVVEPEVPPPAAETAIASPAKDVEVETRPVVTGKEKTSPLIQNHTLLIIACLQLFIITIVVIEVFSLTRMTADLDANQQILIQNDNFLFQVMLGFEKRMRENKSMPGTYERIIETPRFNGTKGNGTKGNNTHDNDNNGDLEAYWNSPEMQNVIKFWRTFAEYGKGGKGVQGYCKEHMGISDVFKWIWDKLTFWVWW